MIRNVLIAGGSGLVGKRLTTLLQQKGYNIAWLGRSSKNNSPVKAYLWDVNKNVIDKEAIQFADAIINLAGAGVMDKRWNDSYKKEIYDSRINSTKLLAEQIAANPGKIDAFINASAIGIYGNDWQDTAREEDDPASTFLAKVCADWENATAQARKGGVRTCFIRTGIVLSENDGFVGQLKTPIKVYAGAAIGNGMQITSWIHIDDLCGIYIEAMENNTMSGPYNAVAPVPTTNIELTRLLAKNLHRSIIFPPIPLFALRIIFGEMATMMVGNQPVSAQKIMDAGYQFRFAQAKEALNHLLD